MKRPLMSFLMKVLIMRHGEAENLSGAVGSDAQRQLTAYGQQQALRAGACLNALGFDPDMVWVSPYQRAQQTANAVLQSFTDTPSQIRSDLVSEANPSLVLAALATAADEHLLIVSHQPLVSELVARLSGLGRAAVPSMAPASMVLLQAEQPFPGCFDIAWHRHNSDFSEHFA